MGMRAERARGERDTDAVDAVVAAMEDDIILGRLRPRERLVEDVLIERYGAKRYAVRQALERLAAMGIVVRARNKGAVVRDFSAREVEDIYELRELLQGHAARRIPLPAPPELVRALTDIHERHCAAVAAGDLRATRHLNNRFHDTLFAACGNPYLVEAIAQYSWLAHAIRSYRIGDPVLLAQAQVEHAQMIEALAAGDRDRLVRLCVDHIMPSKLAYLAAEGGRQGDGPAPPYKVARPA
jgi:DNA-binding GntR family transcriptional regulator